MGADATSVASGLLQRELVTALLSDWSLRPNFGSLFI
jgi:hypothetical protein